MSTGADPSATPRPGGTRVVAVGGGHGLAASLRAVRSYAGEIHAVVTVADDGGSTGRLRAAAQRPAPGDLRKCLVALAEPGSELASAMEHRFDAGELAGHAFGNLMILALAESGGDLVGALDEVGRLVGAAGRVLPATTEVVALCARLRGDATVEGQVAIGDRADVSTVSLDPPDPRACPEAVDAILAADQVVLGPGSLYTSVLAAVAVPGIAAALGRRSGQLVYVCNLRPQHPETEGYGVADHVAALTRHGIEPDVVLYDPSTIGGAEGVDAAVAVAVARPSGRAHDPVLLGRALADLGCSPA